MPRIFANNGNENTPEGLSRVTVSLRVPGDGDASPVVRPLNKSKGLDPHNVFVVSAVQGKKREVVGSWESGSYEVPEGSLLCVRARVERNDGRDRQSLLFLRARAEAAYRSIRYETLSAPVDGCRTVVAGRFDLLGYEDVVTLYGEPSALLQLEHEQSDASWAQIEIKESEITARPVTKNREVVLEGETRRVVSVKRRRNIQL